jgi:hypothetical protein
VKDKLNSSGWSKVGNVEAAEMTAEVLLDAANDLVWSVTVQTRSEEHGKVASIQNLRRAALETVKPEGQPLPGISSDLLARAEREAAE